MSYKFVKITSYYREFLKHYYDANPDIVNCTYSEQLTHLMDQGFAWSNYYSINLNKLGVEANEIVYNAGPLQRAWANENGLSSNGLDIVIEQLKALKPDVVFFQDSIKFLDDWIRKLKEEVPSIKLTIGFCCTNFNDLYLERFKAFDFLVVCSPLFEKAFKEYGLKVYQILHAFEKSVLEKIEINNNFPESDIIFLGSFIPGSDWHDLRQSVVESLLRAGIQLDLYSEIMMIKPMDLFLRQSAFVAANLLKKSKFTSLAQKLPGIKKAYYLSTMPRNPKNNSLIKRNSKPPLYGLEMLKALSHSKMGFNYHGYIAGDYAANIRLFEVTGAGSCLVTDWKRNLNDIFEIDKEVVAFKSAEECVEKVKWLLNHPDEMKKISMAGQKRALRDHSFENRAMQLDEIIRKELNNI